MKSVLIRTGLPLSIAIAAFLLVVPVVSHAQAKTPTPAPSKTPPTPASTSSYTYVAQPGDSLSVLVRKSLQLYDGEQKDIQLSEAAAIYAETNVVQKMGAKLLNIGQSVTVNKADLASFCVASKALTQQQIAAWQQYANLATFNLPNIKPTSGASAAAVTPSRPSPAPATPTPPAPTPATPAPTPQNQPKDDPKDTPESSQSTEESQDSDKDATAAADTKQDNSQTDTKKNNAPWYWWLVGAGTLGILYYLLSGRQTTTSSKK